MEYYFQDNLRWSLGWETPNQAGAFLALLLPLCWMVGACLWLILRGKTAAISIRLTTAVLMLAVVACEVWLWWALAKTYSRGAWVGLGCGVAVGGLGLVWAKRRRLSGGRLIGMAIFARVAVVVACLFISNFSARLAPDYTRADRSALNRIDLWKGGLELVAASPLRGWGWGESGAAYMQWTQPLDRTEGYKSMVNSYLTVAVEAGLPVFAVLLAGMLVPLAAGGWLARGASGGRLAVALGLSACWTTWLGCLFFSNLWIIPKLWIVPGAAALCLIVWIALSPTRFEVGRDRWALREQSSTEAFSQARLAVTPYLGATLVTALGMSFVLWLAGNCFARATPLQLTRESAGIVRLELRGKEASDWFDVYPDPAVLGENYGHELRRWLLVAAHPPALRIQSPVTPVAPPDTAHAAVIFGAQVERVSLAGRRVCLVNPVGVPPTEVSELAKESRVVLAGIDPTGGRYTWGAWAQERGAAVEVNEGLAFDVRLRWPAVMEPFVR
jgi:hypothetical protein